MTDKVALYIISGFPRELTIWGQLAVQGEATSVLVNYTEYLFFLRLLGVSLIYAAEGKFLRLNG